MKKIAVLSLLFCYTCLSLAGQSQPFRQYGTQSVQTRLQTEHSGLIKHQQEIEQYISTYTPQKEITSITIPLVFHILYEPGQPYPTEQDIYAQIDALNRDFNTKQSGRSDKAFESFSSVAANPEINFCLSTKPVSGEFTGSIHYVRSTKPGWALDDACKFSATGGVNAWDTRRYLNIWVVSLTDDIAGYAQMPGGPLDTDGIVIDKKFFGVGNLKTSPYDEGKTLTHLVGNYLGLYDLWNDQIPCLDDYVKDTPLHNAQNVGCPVYKHISACPGGGGEMIMNFMDNTSDACMYMFTQGQSRRMHAVLSEEGPRSGFNTGDIWCNNSSQSSTQEEHKMKVVQVFPNPASRQITITLEDQGGLAFNLQIFNSAGQSFFTRQNQKGSHRSAFNINTEDWPSGIYMVRVQLQDTVISRRIVIEKNTQNEN